MTVSDSNTVHIYDEEFWQEREQAAADMRARIARSRMEVQSFFALSGQSTREDHHRATADLAGLEPLVPGKSTGYTTFDKVAFALNALVNETEGQMVTERRPVVIESQTFPVGLWMLLPDKGALAVANLIGFMAGAPCTIRTWRWERAEAGQQVLSSLSGKTRPARKGERCIRILVETQVERVVEERWVESTHPADPVWSNPYQVEGGFTILHDSAERNLRKPGVEGLSVLVDKDGRFHLVYWITDRFPHTRLGRDGKPYQATRQVAKKPLAVRSFAIPTDVDDVLLEMRRVQSAMARAGHYRDDPVEQYLLPWQAAAMAESVDAPDTTSVPMITGSMEWLQAVADQRMTGQVYRSLGAGPDTDD